MSANLGSFVNNWNLKNCLLYRVVGCLLFRGIDKNGKRVKTSKFSIIWCLSPVEEKSVKQGSTVLVYKAEYFSFNAQQNGCEYHY